MKTIKVLVFFTVTAVFSAAADWESYQLIDRLLTLPGPGAPVVFEDSVIFTASSGLRRAGVAFAHEDFSKVYWFRQLMVPQDPLGAPIPHGRKVPDPYKDSGILFYVHQIPQNIRELEYRLVINGLWTTDPANPITRKDPVSGLLWSVLAVPPRTPTPDILGGQSGTLSFSFRGPPGETVTVAGSFNGWDPFMYELRESPAGVYTLNLPLPPGRYQYAFFHRGQRYVDPHNPRRVYSTDGNTVSEIVIP
ncbi:MAG: glycogen-binding domain-containing protein [Treponema sp.]|nr:glycogen-binding domain-containing protein [Treponema sp.]